jgi:predicted DNA binding CopG/RHH family protein
MANMSRQLTNRIEGEITVEEAEELTRLESAADARYEEERVNMRWARAALETVREAARLHGVPYQTYVKQVAYRQALNDLRDAAAAGVARVRAGSTREQFREAVR